MKKYKAGSLKHLKGEKFVKTITKILNGKVLYERMNGEIINFGTGKCEINYKKRLLTGF